MGCAAGQVTSGSCAGGAAAGAAQSLYAGFTDALKDEQEGSGSLTQEQVELQTEIAGIIGGISAVLATGDVNNLQLGQNIAQSGFTNNYLHHEEELRRQYLLQQLETCESSDASATCKANNAAIQIEINELDARDKARNEGLLACHGDNSAECAQVFTDFNRAQQAWRNEATRHANFANSDLHRNNGGEFDSYNEFLLDTGIYRDTYAVGKADEDGEVFLYNANAYVTDDFINLNDNRGSYYCADRHCETSFISPFPNITTNLTITDNGFVDISGDLGVGITFNNNVAGGPNTFLPLTTETAKMLTNAVIASGVDHVNINSTRGSVGVSRVSPKHRKGQAVDINEVDRLGVDQSQSENRNSRAVKNLQRAFSFQSNVRENYGPFRVEVTGSVGSKPINRADPNSIQTTPWGTRAYNEGVVRKHLDHIHITGQK